MLKKIYCAFSTLKYRNSGTRNSPVLILTDHERDLIHQTIDVEGPIEEGSANFFSFDVQQRNVNSYFRSRRLGLRGPDAWYPEFVFVYADNEQNGRLTFQPIALQYYTRERISTDADEGPISVPLASASLGGNYTPMNRFLILITNDTKRHAGTKSPVLITVSGEQGELLRYEIPEGKLAGEGTTFFTIDRINEIQHSSDIRNISLHIQGDDQWTPKTVLIAGVDNRPDQYEQVVPFVNIPDWASTGLGALSEDANEGKDSITLYQAYL